MFFYNESDSEVSQVVPAPSDPYFYNTSLLLKMDSDFGDSSVHQHTMTLIGNSTISSAESKYGGASGYFDGSGDYLTTPTTTDLQFGTDDFTIETWINPSSHARTAPAIYSNYSTWGGAGTLSIFAGHGSSNSTKYQVAIGGTFPAIQSSVSVEYNTWTHVALSRENGVIKLYINGNLEGSYNYSGALDGVGGNTYLGATGDALSVSYFHGYIDDVRITKGVARYTANFTPPDSHPTTGPSEIVSTDLQLHLDAGDTNSYPGTGTTWYDLSGNGNTFQTSNVGFQADGDLKYFNFVNNNSGQIFQNPSNIYSGVKDHTFEAWVRITSASSYHPFLSYATSNTNDNEILIAKVDNTLRIYQNDASNDYSSVFNGTSTNQWFHLVVAQYDDVLKAYINGTEVKSSTRVGNSNMSGGGYLLFGQEQDSLGGGFSTSQDLVGDISQVRIYTNKGLTATEVLQNFEVTKSRFGL